MSKQAGAFLTIGELSAQLGVPQHILRYWETRFPELRPLQRAGNRRYYRPEDVELASTIHRLLNVEGYTVKGAQQALAGKGPQPLLDSSATEQKDRDHIPTGDREHALANETLLMKLETIRSSLLMAVSQTA